MNTGYTAYYGAECNQDVTKIAGEYLNVKRQNEESFRFLFESEKPEIQQVPPPHGGSLRVLFTLYPYRKIFRAGNPKISDPAFNFNVLAASCGAADIGRTGR